MRRISVANMAKRLVVYCIGLFLMAVGVSISIKSDLGVSPVNSIPYVVSEIVKSISMGTWTTIIYCVFILTQLVILRKKFHPSRFVQILGALLFGRFVDLTNWLVGLCIPTPDNYIVRLGYLIVSMALVGIGILLYLTPNILPLPAEGVMQSLSAKYGFPLYKCKIGFDATVVIIAGVLSLSFFHQFHGVREGTVIAALGVGKFLGVFQKLFAKRLNQFLQTENPPPEQAETETCTIEKERAVPYNSLPSESDLPG